MAAGRLDVLLGLDAAEFTSGLSKAEYEAQKFNTRMVAVGAAIGTFIGQAAVEGAKLFTRELASMVTGLDDLDEAAQALATTAVELSELQIAARAAGVDTEQLGKALTKLNVGVTEASKGANEQADLFKAMGIAVTDSAGKARNATAVLNDLADLFQKLPDGPAKVALAVQIFGEKIGAKLIPYLNQGSDGLRTFSGLTDDTVEAAKKMQDEVDKLAASWIGLKNSIAEQALPAINDSISRLRHLSLAKLLEAVSNAPENGISILQAFNDELARSATEAETAGQVQAELAKKTKEAAAASGKAAEEILKQADANKKAREAALKAAEAQQKYLDAIASDFASYIAALESQVSKTEDLTNEERVLKDLQEGRLRTVIPQQRELALIMAKQADAAKAYELQIRSNADANKEFLDTSTRIEGVFREIIRADDLQKLKDLDFLLESGRISLEQFAEAQNNLAGFSPNIKDASDAAREFGLTFTSAFENAVVEGENLRDVLDGLVKDILRFTTRKLVTEPIANMFADFGKGMTSGGGGDFLSKLFGGLFSGGGQNLTGVYASGTDYVPRDGLAMVHRGERVVTAADNRSGNYGGRSFNIVNNWPAGTTRETAAQAGAAFAQRLSGWNRRFN